MTRCGAAVGGQAAVRAAVSGRWRRLCLARCWFMCANCWRRAAPRSPCVLPPLRPWVRQVGQAVVETCLAMTIFREDFTAAFLR